MTVRTTCHPVLLVCLQLLIFCPVVQLEAHAQSLRQSTPPARQTAGATDATADWERRSRAQGVLVAVGFDHPDEWAKYSYDRDRCNPAYQIPAGRGGKAGCRNNAWDGEVRASGAGSVRFDILSQTDQGAGGNMAIPFGDYATHQFGAHGEFWVSWRQRMDRRFMAGYKAAGGGGRYANAKQVIIAQGDMPTDNARKLIVGNACSEAEVVIVGSNPGRPTYPTGYIECGRYVAFEEVLKPNSYAGEAKGSLVHTRQNMRRNKLGQFSCIGHPDSLDQSGCFIYRPDEWITYMVHLKLGPEGKAVSSVSRKEQPGFVDSLYEFFAAYDGEDFQMLHRQSGVVIPRGQYFLGGDPLLSSSYKGGWGPADGHPQAKFGKLWLLPYMTNKDVTEISQPASTWYDEVIISRCRIAAPGKHVPDECNPSPLATSAGVALAVATRSPDAAIKSGAGSRPAPAPQQASTTPDAGLSASRAAALSPLQLSGVLSNLPPGHWFEIAGSAMSGVQVDACKVKAIREAYERVISDMASCNPERIMSYSGGAYDSTRHRLLVWGGGHSTYAGNEIYAFDLARARWSRLTEPSPPVLEKFLDGDRKKFTPASPYWHDPKFAPAPVSVHSYDQLEYLPDQDQLFAAGGATYSANGYASGLTWLFDLKKDDATGWKQAQLMPGKAYGLYEFNMSTAYDPVSRRVLMRGYSALGSFNPVDGTWKVALDKLPSRTLGTVGEVDPKRRAFVVIGGGVGEIYRVGADGELGPPQALASAGDKEIEQCYAPGFAYDSKAERLVAWCGKGDVYSLNLDKRAWTRHSAKSGVAPGDPASTAGIRGTFGRFRYMPEYNAYVVVNGTRNNVFLYRLSDDKGLIP